MSLRLRRRQKLHEEPHPGERPLGRVSKDATPASWFETAQVRLLTMRTQETGHAL
jgi:hypothetical protein